MINSKCSNYQLAAFTVVQYIVLYNLIMITRGQRYKFDELEQDGEVWMRKCMDLAGVNHVEALGKKSFANISISKDSVSGHLYDAIMMVNRQNKLIANLRGQAQLLKTDVIEYQESVIKLKDDLITTKDEQLRAFQSSVEDSVKSAVEITVKNAVEDSVKTEFKSYSDVAKTNLPTSNSGSSPLINETTLKTVIKNVVEEEDRSRN